MTGSYAGATPGAPNPSARPTRPEVRLHRTWFERTVLSLGVIAMAMCLFTAGTLAWAMDKYENIAKIEIASVAPAEVGEPSNWLLVGTDSREGIDPNDPDAGYFLGEGAPDGKRTDSLIVARVDPGQGRIDLLSIPRDLYVPLAGGGEGRINSALTGEGGEERLVNTITQNLGIPINHYAEVNFVGFRDIVDGLGGVAIWFDSPMRDPGSGLDIPVAGCHVLDGIAALGFVRARHLEYFADGAWHTDGTGDLGRSSRQQHFIRRVVDTTMQKVNITELGTLNNVLNIGGRNLTIDDGAEPGTLLALARAFGGIESDRIYGHALPVYDFRTSAGAAVLGLIEDEAEPILAFFRGEAPPGEDPGPVTTPAVYTVLNGSRTAGQAAQAAEALRAANMTVERIDNGPDTERTLVRYPTAMLEGARALGAYLVVEPEFELDDTLTSVVLITGTDFQGLLPAPREHVNLPAADDPAQTPGHVPAPPETEAVGVVPGPTPEGTACA